MFKFFPKTKVQIRKKFLYKECPIYILQFHDCFMRLFVFQGEVFQNHVVLPPESLWRYLGFIFGLRDTAFGEKELEGMDEALMRESIKAIDHLFSEGSFQKAKDKINYPSLFKNKKKSP